MSKFPVADATVQRWLLDGPLAAYASMYLARLQQGRYSKNTIRRKLHALAHVGRWMALCRCGVETLDERRIDHFLHDHVPRCRCPLPLRRYPADEHAVVSQLLALLRELGVVAVVRAPGSPIDDELQRYDAHMRDARGLACGTREHRLRIVQRLLLSARTHELTPEHIRRFLADQLELRNTVSNAVAINSALRDYLRWRSTCGAAVQPLLGVIARPARWRMTSLPRSLTSEEVERVLQACAAARASPKRSVAVVRLALDLGLRIGEIAGLQLDDIDWERGTIILRGTKSRRQDVLPLQQAAGKALADYIRHERPSSSHRAVFVSHLAPRGRPIIPDALRALVKRAFRRAGITNGCSHALRHTLACRLVNSGSPIKEVADILRHRSLDTTQIYAKVDLRALAEVAMPWPGSTARTPQRPWRHGWINTWPSAAGSASSSARQAMRCTASSSMFAAVSITAR
jgi:integrase/recombinase XerC